MRRSMWSIGVATLAGGCVSQARFVDLDQRYDQVVASRDQALAERDKAREEVGQVTTALEAADRRIQAAHERLRGWAEERSWADIKSWPWAEKGHIERVRRSAVHTLPPPSFSKIQAANRFACGSPWSRINASSLGSSKALA